MLEPPPYPREAERLATLRSLNLLDTPIEQRFERITKLVCRLLDVPIAHFNLLDADRQHLKSSQGLSAVDIPIGGGFCTHTIHEESILVLPDASKDVRFWDNPFVTGRLMNIRFYAGCPVRAPNGLPIGTLCAIDTKPREMTREQLTMLRDLADMLELELCVSGLNNAHSQLVAQLDAAERLARVDCLTRLWNRTGIFEIIEKDWAEAQRHARPLAFVVADLDHFKSINDTYGHQVGDAVISMTAKVLLANTRGGDSVGRMGGEEFLAVLTSCEPQTLLDAVERLRTGVMENEYIAGDTRLPITISCGAAVTVPTKGTDWMALVKKADDALYAAKRQGRNRSIIDSAIDVAA